MTPSHRSSGTRALPPHPWLLLSDRPRGRGAAATAPRRRAAPLAQDSLWRLSWLLALTCGFKVCKIAAHVLSGDEGAAFAVDGGAASADALSLPLPLGATALACRNDALSVLAAVLTR